MNGKREKGVYIIIKPSDTWHNLNGTRIYVFIVVGASFKRNGRSRI